MPTASPSSTSQFTIGKLDAGIAVLRGFLVSVIHTAHGILSLTRNLICQVGESSHLVEFPSCLLPNGCKPGSIVNIACQRNTSAEQEAAAAFWHLQDLVMDTFGRQSPEPPVLRVRNATQTAVALEWDPLKLATAKVLSLSVWKNSNVRLANIPNPLSNTATKLTGLDLDAPYQFHLVLQTTAGTYASNVVKTRTHPLNDTSGIRVCFGTVQPPELLDACHEWLEQMGAQATDSLQIDTTHFVCTHPSSSQAAPKGTWLFQRASQMSIPTVVPAWLGACVKEKRLAPVKNYAFGGEHTPTSSVPPNRHRASHSASASRASLVSASTAQPRAAPVSEEPQVPPTPEKEEPPLLNTTAGPSSQQLPQEQPTPADSHSQSEPTLQDEPAQDAARQPETSGVELSTPVDEQSEYGTAQSLPTAAAKAADQEQGEQDDAQAAAEKPATGDEVSEHSVGSTGDMEDVKL